MLGQARVAPAARRPVLLVLQVGGSRPAPPPARLLGRVRIPGLRVGVLRLRRVARDWLILRLRLVLLLRVGAVGRLLLLLVVGGHGRIIRLLGLAPGVHGVAVAYIFSRLACVATGAACGGAFPFVRRPGVKRRSRRTRGARASRARRVA